MSFHAGITGLILLSLVHVGFAADEAKVQIIVKYKQAIPTILLKNQLKQTVNLPLITIKPIAGGAQVLTFDSKNFKLQGIKDSEGTELILKQLRQSPGVIYALNDRIGHFKPTPQISSSRELTLLSHDLQWDEFSPPGGVMLESASGLRDGAWFYSTGEAIQPIVIAVLDTGIALNLSLVKNLVKDEQDNIVGWNFSANNADIHDETRTYHGTHVAGTIASYGNVVLGMGEHLKILPVKIPDANGMFYESQVINAIYWSVGGEVPGVPKNVYPAKVLNMSFGVDERPGKEKDHCDAALQEALDFARSKGAVITVAAGNENRVDNFSAPAVCSNTINVAATGPEGFRAYYSNYGPSIDFAAPGGDLYYGKQGGILSTVNPGGGYQHSGFDFYQGTSMASPHVAGVAGLIYAIKEGDISAEKVEKILRATTHAFGQSKDSNNSCLGNISCGTGILDADNAIKAAIADYDEIFTTPKISLKACDKNTFQPDSALFLSTNSLWLLINSACQSRELFSKPQLSFTQEGKIIANYGRVSYQLNDSAFKQCQIIGVQGIGCYF